MGFPRVAPTPAEEAWEPAVPTPEALLLLSRRMTPAERCRFLQMQVADLLGEGVPGRPAWSKPDTVTRWARRFGLKRNAMGRLLRCGKLRCRRLGSRWQIATEDLPADPPGPR
jgi:hypothetical protein